MTPQLANQSAEPHVVVVGGGFAGLEATRRLRKAPVRITLVDRHNYHLFQPLLYQVATAALSPADIAYPIRSVFRSQANVSVRLAEVTAVDLEHRTVATTTGSLEYDYLVLAAGATHSYFGHDDWMSAAPGLKTIDDALEIRRRILLAFEEAEQEPIEQARRAKLTFVIVGGGPTGVEMAGAIKEIAARSIPRDFRRIDTKTTRVILVEAGPRLLLAMDEALGRRAARDLEAMGVEVRVNSQVTAVDKHGVTIGDERLAAENVFWAAGVQASPLAKSLGVPLDRNGRVIVGPDLSPPDHREAFVLGDLAQVIDPLTQKMVPGVAPAAIQMGRYVASVIRREVTQPAAAGERPPFVYRDKGTMATIGRARAVATVAGRHFTDFVAWLMWSLLHVTFLIGFRNKLFVMLSWAWNYVLWRKTARLITGNPTVEVSSGEE